MSVLLLKTPGVIQPSGPRTIPGGFVWLAPVAGIPTSAGKGGRFVNPVAATTIGVAPCALSKKFTVVTVYCQKDASQAQVEIFRIGAGSTGVRWDFATSGGGSGVDVWTLNGVANGASQARSTSFNTLPRVSVASFDPASFEVTSGVLGGAALLSYSNTASMVAPSNGSVIVRGGPIQFYGIFILPYRLSRAQAVELVRNPWQLFSTTAPIWVPAASGGGTPTLTVADATHGHTADSLVLTSSTALVIAEATHGHAADNLTLDAPTGTSLTVADATHAHTADALTLSTDAWLTVADALHAHAADNLALTLDTWLVVADALHAHAADNLALTLDTWLVVADALHAHAADNLDLSGAPALVIADALHAHAADNLALTLDTWLAIQDAVHAHTVDNLHFGGLYSTLDLIYKILANRQELNPATGKFTLYDDDGVSILYQANAWADAAGTIPYTGGTLARIDALA